MSKTVTIVVPMRNEEQNIALLFSEFDKLRVARPDLRWTFLFVNDGSTDRSAEMLAELADREPACQVITLARNFGHQCASTAGLDYADGDIICLIDADLQDPPAVLLEMVAEIERGYNIVYGQRTQRDGESRFKRLTASGFYRLLAYLTDVEIPVDTGDFRAMDRKALDAVKGMREYHRFLRGMIAWVGYRTKAVKYVRAPRHRGQTNYSVGKMVRFALDAIFSFSAVPLKFAGYIGTTIALGGLAGLIYILAKLVFYRDYLPGVSAVLFAVLFIGGVQLITLGIIGAYVGRIFEESKDRPLYIVDTTRNLGPNDQR